MDNTTRRIILIVGIVSLIVFFLKVAIIVYSQIIISGSEYARELFGQGYLEDYLSGYSFSQDLRRLLSLVEIESMFNLLFFLVVGVGCILIFFKTPTTRERIFGKPENPQETEETRTTELFEPKEQGKPVAEKSVKPSDEKTKGRIILLSGLVFLIVYIWQFLSVTNVPPSYNRTFDLMMFVFPLFYGLIAACVVGIIIYAIVKYRIVEIDTR